MDALELNDDQRSIQDLVREFARKEVAPGARKRDETGEFPADLIRRMAELNLLGIPVPEDLGGAGLDALSLVLTIEEIAKACGSTALTLAAHTSLGTLPILLFGDEAQKKSFIPPLARGERIGAYGLTEPGAGSDAGASQTTARRADGGYLLNGAKQFCTNARHAGSYIVTAVTDRAQSKSRSISAFILERGFRGLRPGKTEDKLGMRASDTTELILEDVFVPEANRLGAEGEGFRMFMQILDGGRIGIGALALGLAEAALERSARYAQERRAFGKPIGGFQAIQFMLADMATEIEAARHLIYHTARLKDLGRPFSREASMAKLFASEMAMRVTRNAIQVLGGNGYMAEYEVERLYRDAKLCEIGEGTSEVQRIVIARQMVGKLE